MNRDALLDSSYLVALLDGTDVWHKRARAIAEALDTWSIASVVSDCVINEVASVLARRCRDKGRNAAAVLRELLDRFPPHELTYLYPEIRRMMEPAFSLMAATDGRLSFHDALLGLSAREMGTGLIVTFDLDFTALEWLRVVSKPEDLHPPQGVREGPAPREFPAPAAARRKRKTPEKRSRT